MLSHQRERDNEMPAPNLRDIRYAADPNTTKSLISKVVIAGIPHSVHIGLRILCSFNALPNMGHLLVTGGEVPFEMDVTQSGIRQIDLGSYVCKPGADLVIELSDAADPVEDSPNPLLSKTPTAPKSAHREPHADKAVIKIEGTITTEDTPAPRKQPAIAKLNLLYYSIPEVLL